MSLLGKEAELARILALRDTVIFAGSGLSVWSGLPNWKDLIEKLIGFVEQKTGTTQAAAHRSFINGDLLVSADHLVRKISRVELAQFLSSDLNFANACPHRVHQLLESLGPKCFITTNYDQLIEKRFILSTGQMPKVVTNRQVADFADIIRADAQNFVFKIHGSIENSESIVISESDYYEIILNHFSAASGPVLEAIKILMVTRPIIFLGYSVRDPDLLLVMRFLQQAFDRSAGRYWAVLPDLDADEEARLWDVYRIRSLSYATRNQGTDHTAFLELLEGLAVATRTSTPPLSADPTAIALSVARYGMRLSKLDPGPGLEINAFIWGWESLSTVNVGLEHFKRTSIENILKNFSNSLVLEGPAGSGKSFAIRRYLAKCGEALQDWALSDSSDGNLPTFPILLDARLYGGDFASLATTSLSPGINFHKIEASMQAVIIVDSLDEMPSEHLDAGVWGSDLKNFADRFSDCRIVFGTRRSDLVPIKGLPVFHVDSLDGKVVNRVLKESGTAFSKVGRHLQQVLSIPFMLTLAKRFLRTHSGIRNPGPLIETFLRFSIEKIEPPARATPILVALQKVAWSAMQCGRDTIATNDIELALAKVSLTEVGSDGRLVDHLVAQGLLVSELDSQVRFVHRTVLEYLAAKEFAYRYSEGVVELKSILSSRRWDNAVAWSVTFLSKAQLSKMISQICKQDQILALHVADAAEIGRGFLLSAVLREIRRNPPRLFGVEGSVAHEMSKINFPIETQHELRALAKGAESIAGASAAALVPHMNKKDIRLWMTGLCRGDFGYNYSKFVGSVLANRFKAQDLKYFLDVIKSEITPKNIDEESDNAFGVEAIISGMNISNRNFVRDWSSKQNEAIRLLVAKSIEKSDARDDLQFLIDQWVLGTPGISYSLYITLEYGNNPFASELFQFTGKLLHRLRNFLLSAEDKKWTLGLLRTAVDKFPSWKVGIDHVVTEEENPFLRRAYRLALAKYHRNEAAEIFSELQAGSTSTQQLIFLELFDEIDWRNNWPEVIKLLLSDNVDLVQSIGEEILPPRFVPSRSLHPGEIDSLVGQLSFWHKSPQTREIWFVCYQLIGVISAFIDADGCQHLIARAEGKNDPHRKLILAFIIPRISNTLVTTNDLTEETGQFMLNEYVTNPLIDDIAGSPGAIATEQYIEKVVLPAAARFKNKPKQRQKLGKILTDAGRRHGRRYQF
jgi:hypothetical protein